MIGDGRLKASRVIGRAGTRGAIRIRVSEIDRYLKDNEVQPEEVTS
jgi:hypothetical protein